MRTKSKKPNKQRYYQYNIPKHENHKLLSASVSKKLKQEKGLKSLPIREGDEVLIVRGSHKGKSGKVNKVAAIGIKVKKWIAYHGFSININSDSTNESIFLPNVDMILLYLCLLSIKCLRSCEER